MSLKDKFIDFSYSKEDMKKINIKNKSDLAYIDSVSSSMLMQKNKKTRIILWVSLFIVIWMIIWAYFAKIDILTRGEGKVIPSNKIQVVQNLEGGIISEILVKEGAEVKKGDVLIKIDATNFQSIYLESKLKYNELQAKSLRLLAESTGKAFYAPQAIKKKSPLLIQHEFSLYKSNQKQLKNSINIYKNRLKQKQSELKEAKAKIKQLKSNYKLILKELKFNQRLLKKHLVSEVEFLQLQRKANGIYGEIKAIELSLPRLKSMIEESKDNIKGVRLKFQNKAKEAYNEVRAEMQRIKKINVAREDKVRRTYVRSPVDGTIKRLLVNTVGGVVKPAMDIAEIVPSQDNLIIEAKIRPSDIAFLYPGQRAIVKFSAYNFAIYGSLEGTLTHISAGTIIDEIDKKSYYLVHIKTDKNYLGTKDKKLKIIVGMTANVDIITGKTSVLNFILEPILRAENNVWSGR
ncbi:HlyD family secretion protein [hydrothermal vent metagenome]|uniref:HlyD family secretion protein n=1 Tax=hydrothermal vent metagenome TaxID=652676 RepID=A0A1W1D4Y0_9ZZZZ